MPSPRLPTRVARADRGLLVLLLVVPLLASIGAYEVFDHAFARTSLWSLSNLVGPTAESLSHGQGLNVCTEAMGTPGDVICFHAGRMPLPSLVVAFGVQLFGDHFLRVALFKVMLFLMPVQLGIWLVWRCLPAEGWRRWMTVFLLLVPFGMTTLLADVVNLQVEEGYSYSLVALAVAILFFGLRGRGGSGRRVVRGSGLMMGLVFALCLVGVYLAKSAMVLVVGVLLVAFLVRERSTAVRALVLALVLCAPAGWALHQHHASGRYSVGTSIDGINLHKGNNAEFLARYPPAAGSSLDQYDSALNLGHTFTDEWIFNDFHQRAAVEFMRAEPGMTSRAAVRKLEVIFLTVTKLGSAESHGVLLLVETAGIVGFRVMLWVAMGFSVYGLMRPGDRAQGHGRVWRAEGAIFLALTAACAVPYVLGFAYTRHVSVLILPSALMCCAVLASETSLEGDGRARRQAVH